MTIKFKGEKCFNPPTPKGGLSLKKMIKRLFMEHV